MRRSGTTDEGIRPTYRILRSVSCDGDRVWLTSDEGGILRCKLRTCEFLADLDRTAAATRLLGSHEAAATSSTDR
jgi:hypothetical protein